jgi:hypothetical protein
MLAVTARPTFEDTHSAGVPIQPHTVDTIPSPATMEIKPAILKKYEPLKFREPRTGTFRGRFGDTISPTLEDNPASQSDPESSMGQILDLARSNGRNI